MKKDITTKSSNLVEHLSHELRTPLSAILGYSALLKKSSNLDSIDQEHLEKITSSGTRLLDVINDIIELSNIESGNIEISEQRISLSELRDQVAKKFTVSARLKELNFDVQLQDSSGSFFVADQKKIQTVIFSLISNAIKFTETGSVKVNMSMTAGVGESGELNISVFDTGPGIANSDFEHIFNPFWRADLHDDRGSGLGLTTSKKLVQMLGGSLGVESQPAKGSEFKLSIPVTLIKEPAAVERKAKVNQVTPKKGSSPQKLKALIVDDLDINRTLARIMLEMKDFSTLEAVNGVEALDQYIDHQPDVVLMDISMPKMDGIEAMEKIRNINVSGHQIPIIAISAGGHTGSPDDLIEKGFSEYIQKPFKEEELFEKIAMFLPLHTYDKTSKQLKGVACRA